MVARARLRARLAPAFLLLLALLDWFMRTATIIDDPKLTRIASALREAFGTRLVSALLFGSRARGDHRPDSDYDVAVLLEDFDREADREILAKVREALGE